MNALLANKTGVLMSGEWSKIQEEGRSVSFALEGTSFPPM